MCWYCERRCAPTAEVGGRAATVDHFMPLSRFPGLAYEWSNWVFSCRGCNEESKQDKWPENGYADPGAANAMERPERYFDYDMKTHDVVPRDGLSEDELRRAWGTIDDLGLNRLDVKFYRQGWMQSLINDIRGFPIEERCSLAEYFANHASEFLGTTRMVLAQLREAGEIGQSP